ncbi:RNase adapter RapZ [Mesotoga prima]|uniref:RNase adapter RapZ n=1 Tax=Mesotoga prima TaxID=1184387 RepID=UPI002C92D688|nr:RNase adapter RapZ [Mesotoga prima]HNQ71391.1 RNase adapter RapZ [Mesotoga prima]HNS76446.1 RNase adapter RapZ [Mesotoga prima]
MSSNIFVVTGMSGAGKSSAIDVLEDFGFFCMDNVPPSIIEELVNIIGAQEIDKSAVVIDIRTAKKFGGIDKVNQSLRSLKERGLGIVSIFLDAEDDVLYYRYQKTRRAHPLQEETGLEEAIQKERSIMDPFKKNCDHVIDTSRMDMKEMKETIVSIIRGKGYKLPPMRVEIESFSYNEGVPHDANLIFDVRFLPNPYYYEELIELTGMDKKVKDYLETYPEIESYFSTVLKLCRMTIEGFAGSGRNFMKIAVGCTGGKHRSVYIADRLFEELKTDNLRLSLDHREQKVHKDNS